MKLTTKTVSCSTRKINANVTREQITDLNNFNRSYVYKDKLNKIINNDLISSEEKDEKCLYVYINYKLLKRVEKLFKITKDETIEETINYVKYVDSIKYTGGIASEIEGMLAEELSKNIDREIIKNLMNLKK